MTAVNEAQWSIVTKNRRKKDEVKEHVKLSNYIKRVDRIIKRGSLYDNTLYVVANLPSVTKTTEDSNESILKAIPHLSYETLKESFIHMG